MGGCLCVKNDEPKRAPFFKNFADGISQVDESPMAFNKSSITSSTSNIPKYVTSSIDTNDPTQSLDKPLKELGMETSSMSANEQTKVNQTMSTEIVRKMVKPPEEVLRNGEVSQKVDKNDIPSKDGNVEENGKQPWETENVKEDARVVSSSVVKEEGAVSPQTDLIKIEGQEVIATEWDNHAGTEPLSQADQTEYSAENDESSAPLEVPISDQVEKKDLEVAKKPSTSNTREPRDEMAERRASCEEPPCVQSSDKSAPSSQAEEKDFEVEKQPSTSNTMKPEDDMTKVDKERRESYDEKPTVQNNVKSSSQVEEKDQEAEEQSSTLTTTKPKDGVTNVEKNKRDTYGKQSALQPVVDEPSPSVPVQDVSKEVDASVDSSTEDNNEEYDFIDETEQDVPKEYRASVRRLSITSLPRFSQRESKQSVGIKELSELFS